MKNTIHITRILSLILAASLLLSGCGLIPLTDGGEMRTETHSVEVGSAASVKVQVEMDQGMLNISSGGTSLMEGTFRYNVSEWKPQIQYSVEGSQGSLLVNQPAGEVSGLVRNGESTWDLRLGESLPLELIIKVGTGEIEVDLTEIDLTDLTVDTGMGSLELDLRGSWDHNINIAIDGGLGDVTLHLPAEIGARVEIKNGLGSVNSSGMDKDGNAYVNGAYGESPYTLFIRIDNGAGSVNLES